MPHSSPVIALLSATLLLLVPLAACDSGTLSARADGTAELGAADLSHDGDGGPADLQPGEPGTTDGPTHDGPLADGAQPLPDASPDSAPAPCSGITVTPSQSLADLVAQNAAGTTYCIAPGVHRLSKTVTPEDGDSFIGQPGAILSGAKLLAPGDFTKEGNLWVIGGQSQSLAALHTTRCANLNDIDFAGTDGAMPYAHPNASSSADYDGCGYSEDLFLDHKVLWRVTDKALLGSGAWTFDKGADKIYIADDPAGRTIETTVVERAFSGSATGVTIRDLVIEKFGPPAQAGAIHGNSTKKWLVQGCEIRFSHGVGLRIGDEMTVKQTKIHHSGQLGIGGVGKGSVLVEGNEIYRNLIRGYAWGWEGGGSKFVKTDALVVRDNHVHHNKGPGLWTDIDNINTLYEKNNVHDNSGPGIFHEISYKATIRHNTVTNNGWGGQAWLWGAGIQIAASGDVEVHDNVVSGNANGIAGLQQNRGSGAHGEYLVKNLHVHHNTVTLGNQAAVGLVQDVGEAAIFTSRNNRFEDNTYHGSFRAAWNNGWTTDFGKWQSYGQDTQGSYTP